ncbi:MAG: hypothetical protein HY898_06020 [Deltaproteobacteria bacterium]|nr:hypothetical protein [Deltaproteobacteria bacterium]
MLASDRAFWICSRVAAGCAFAVAMAFVLSPSACLLTVSLDGLADGELPVDAGVGGGGGTGGTSGCKVGFADCNTDSVCETNIASDKLNCGTCNHSCQGSTCTGGRCDPVLLASGNSPVALAQDDTYIYWADKGTSDIKRYRKDNSGQVDPLATGQANPTDIAVDDTNVYWSLASGTVTSTTKVPGGVPKNLATQQSPLAIALDGTSIYWVNGTSGSVEKAPKAGGTKTTLASGVMGPSDIAVGGSDVYFIAFGESKLKKVSTSGGTPTDVATGLHNPLSIVLDGTYIYLAEQGTDAESFADGAISRITRATVNKEVLAPMQGAPHSVAVAPKSDYAYWGLFNNQIVMAVQLPPAGQAAPSAVSIATELAGSAISVLADDKAVYWISGANIVKVAR